MTTTIAQQINAKQVRNLVVDDNIQVMKEISDLAHVNLVSNTGFIKFERNIDGDARLLAIAKGYIWFKGELNGDTSTKLVSQTGWVKIEGAGKSKRNLNSQAHLEITAKGDVIIHSDLNSHSSVEIISKTGSVHIEGDLNDDAKLSIIAEDNIIIKGDINSHATVQLTSTRGTITVAGHIHSNSKVRLTAAHDITVGEINGYLSVMARSAGTVRILGSISNQALVEIEGLTGIDIGGKIDGAIARLAVATGKIIVRDKVENGSSVQYWPKAALVLKKGGQAQTHDYQWLLRDLEINNNSDIEGSWWTNWFWSYGYVSNQIKTPRTRDELIDIIKKATPGQKIKAVGGGWSASDMTLPMDASEVKQVSIFDKGKSQKVDLRDLLRFIGVRDTPMDLYPDQVVRSLNHSTRYDQTALKKVTKSGIDLPPANSNNILLDTRGLKSSLQHQRDNPRFQDANGNVTYLFWVEAGITMSELNELLDHQKPRLAIQASGGSPGATLAGTISTATHGGEFQDPLLVDRVKAIHLIGPGGKEWWIEGNMPVIGDADLRALYGPGLQIINHNTPTANLPTGLTAEDLLKTVVVSMGAIGVIYSVVLEVVEQFSIQQITKKVGDWDTLLSQVIVNSQDLRDGDPSSNDKFYDFLADGMLNGTKIPLSENRYIDLGITPYSQTCWIVNRRFIDTIATHANAADDQIRNYQSAFANKMTEGAEKALVGGQLLGRMVDFWRIARNLPNFLFQISDLTKVIDEAAKSPLLLSSLLAYVQAQALSNRNQNSRQPISFFDKQAYGFLIDITESLLDALQATYEYPISDFTGLSYEVGAIGWPGTGIPGRGFEVALPARWAFTYIQKLLDRINDLSDSGNIFLGYVSVRVCPRTRTLMGMQQYNRSVMVEVVAHRTPTANIVFDDIIDFTKTFDVSGRKKYTRAVSDPPPLFPNMHWGLETERFDRAYLDKTVLNTAFKPGTSLTRLEAFEKVKAHISKGQPLVFDNAFVGRMGL